MLKKICDKYFEMTKGQYPFFKYCPKKYHKEYINRLSSLVLGYDFDYTKPRTFNEKIRWLIYNEKLPIKCILSDKIKVKTYITEKIGYGHCAQIYGIWDNFDDIEFSYLPDKFVLKTTNSWYTNVIVKKKIVFKKNIDLIRKIMKERKKVQFEYFSLEPQYRVTSQKFFVEQFLDIDIDCDYQVHCFNGKPELIEVLYKSDKNIFVSRFYSMDWKNLPYQIDNQCPTREFTKPEFLEEMLEYAKILSAEFSYVRVDFTHTHDNKLIVLELTFTPHACKMKLGETADFELGKMINL